MRFSMEQGAWSQPSLPPSASLWRSEKATADEAGKLIKLIMFIRFISGILQEDFNDLPTVEAQGLAPQWNFTGRIQ